MFDNSLYNAHGIELIKNDIVRKTVRFSSFYDFTKIKRICSFLTEYPSDMIVPIYSFTALKNNSYGYSYDMKRLFKLSDDESIIIEDVSNIWFDLGRCPIKISDYYNKKIINDNQKLINFLQNIVNHSKYRDLHSGNIMKDENSNFKLIDIEGFLY